MKKLKKLFICLILIVICIGAIYVKMGYDMYTIALTESPIEEKLEQIKNKENYAEFSELPKMYVNAVISVEDHRFYTHCGIDIIAIGRAIVNDIKAMDFVEGGSTITQQLAKNIYFTQEKKLERKIAEILMAFKIESICEKDEIFELYVNTSYFGDGYYTVKEASAGYFNKIPNNMTADQCIMLAGIPNAPSVYAPTKNIELAKQRQKQVANKMIRYGYLTEEDVNKILK